jgi:spermidine synthase
MPDTPYSVITISAVCLLLYGTSLALVRFDVISGDLRRKILNILLLISALVAGSIGLILAISVNFKINLPATNKLLVWHVDFGVALLLIALFHFLHHLNYYRNLFNNTSNQLTDKNKSISLSSHIHTGFRPGFNLKGLPFSLGFTAIAAQLILIRELLFIFNGNELTIGTILANWMLLTATGAFLRQKYSQPVTLKKILTGLLILAIIPLAILFILYRFRDVIVPVGLLPSLGQIFAGTVLLLSPFCLLSGWLFTEISKYLSNKTGDNAISHTYGWETIGSIVSGLLCSMILVFLFEPFQNLAIILIINTILLFLIVRKEIFNQKKKFFYLALAATFGFVTLIANPDSITIRYLYPDQEVLFFEDTPYGKLVITDQAGQLNFFDNNTLLFTTNNIITNEETVHYALLQRKHVKNVLLIGGSITGVAEECLKYPLQRLDCVELNPRIPGFGKRLSRLPDDPRFRLFSGDARVIMKKRIHEISRLSEDNKSLFKKQDSLRYDAVILNVPEPSTLQINRFYTYEFLSKCKNLLTEHGTVSLSLMSTADYVGDDALKIQSTLYQTLKALFRNVLVIPGEKNFFLASDDTLTARVASLGAKRGIETEYVNEYYLDDISVKQRSEAIMKRISVAAPLNFDFEPVGCFRQMHYWLSFQGNINFYILFIPVLLLLVFAGIRSGGTTIALFSAGLVSFSLEIILILTFQVIYGYAYIATGIFITFFMAGLATGVFFARRFPKKCTYKMLVIAEVASVCIILLSIASIFTFKQSQLPDSLVYSIFSVLIVCIAMITGVQFHVVSVLKKGDLHQVAASSYSADLIGSAAGALLVNAWIVPALGLMSALYIIAGINALVILVMLLKKQI